MKKLMMIAAAMTIAGGAFAQDATCGFTTDGECALVYKLKMSLKTTIGKPLGASTDACGIGTAAACYRDKGSLSLNGYALSDCACECDDFQDMEWLLFSKKTKMTYFDDFVDWEFVNIFGKKENLVEGAWTIDDGVFYLVGAGQGTWYDKSGLAYVKKISGYVAGWAAAPECTKDVCEPAYAFDCTALDTPDSALPTAVYGKWSMSYNKSLSKKLAEGELDYDKIDPGYDFYDPGTLPSGPVVTNIVADGACTNYVVTQDGVILDTFDNGQCSALPPQ